MKLSIEKQAQAKARKDAIRALARKVAAMTDEERSALLKMPIRTIEGRPLSATNQMLIMMQSPRATFVGGFRQWKTAGRQVRKGEHGIGIWFPCTSKKENESEPDDLYFSIGYVFDIEQTEMASES